MQATATATAPAPRFTLRQLPLPAKLVVTLFMLTVGLGYFSALVQMHFQHTQGDGQPMPGVNDVIEIFAGKKWVTREEAAAMRPQSKLERMITGPRETFGAPSMTAAFFEKDQSGDWDKVMDKRNPNAQAREKIEAERTGEHKVVLEWLLLPEADRKLAYETDLFKPKEVPASITESFLHAKGNIANGVKIKSILDARCAVCHKPGGDEPDKPLDTYSGLAKYLEVPPAVEIPADAAGAWCVSSRQISREKLAQSTHAHLLSFAMLFGLTGFVFSFTSHRSWIRFIVAPMVLVAQVADVSCWWLARIDGPGVYFAQAIMATGAFVGIGLGAQIVLSVFNMYGLKGKAVLAVLFIGAGLGLGLVGEKFAKPFLADLKAKKEKEQADTEAAKKKPEGAAKPPEKKDNGPMPPVPMMAPTLEKLLIAADWQKAPWGRDKVTGRVPEGGMVKAFFDRSDDEFKDALKKKDKEPDVFKQMVAERTGELSVVQAWIKAKPEDRKKGFDKDEFPLPTEMKGKPFTADFFANDKAVKIRTLFETRCMRCHGENDTVQLDTFEKLEKFLK